MTTSAHLWALGYDNMERAQQVRDELTNLAWGTGQGGRSFLLLDSAVVVRHPDGSFTCNHKPFPGIANILSCTAVGFLAGLVLAAPLAGAAVVLVGAGTAASAASSVGIDSEFILNVAGLMKPGTSALFVLDEAGDMEVILHTLHGSGGTVLKTNVDVERARLVQSTLAASTGTSAPGDK